VNRAGKNNDQTPTMNTLMRTLAGPWVPPELGKKPYFWLFSLCFAFWKYFYIPPQPIEIVLLVVIVGLFLPVYLYSYWTSGARAVLCVLFTCLLAAVWTPYNFGAGNLFIFACAMCGRLQPPRRAYQMMGAVMVIALVASTLISEGRMYFVLPLLVVGIPIGLASISEASLARSRKALERKQEEVEHMARIAERERISRDLHDLLGHSLSMIALKAELAGKLAERDVEACRSEIRDIESAAREALSEVRAAVTGYRHTGLVSALATARASLAAANVELHEEVQPFALPPAKENVLALALREAVTNIIRHAGASRCTLGLAREDGMAVLRIADDGRGATGIKHGNGLAGMQERAAAAGGTLSINADAGVAIELRLPMGEAA
jgi:two-component system sensor histidine kinase DesK